MKEWSGYFWPNSDVHCAAAITSEALMFMGKFLARVPGRDIAVQAGGNVGVYPLSLAQSFRTVHTFEPEWENFKCLCANLDRIPVEGTVTPYRAALGSEVGSCGLRQGHDDNTGTFHVHGTGTVPMQTIDALNLPVCDLIWLDVEGYELEALKGAEQTIVRLWPAVIVEENGLATTHGHGDASGWLRERGYRPILKHGNDCLYLKETTRNG